MSHSKFARALHHLRHYLLNVNGKFIFLLDLVFASFTTWIAMKYCQSLYRGPWFAEQTYFTLSFDFVMTGVMLWFSGIYKTFVRYTTMKDLERLIVAILLANMFLGAFNILFWPEYTRLHIAGVIFNFLITSLALIGCRMACIGGRRWLEQFHSNQSITLSRGPRPKRAVLTGRLEMCLLRIELIRKSRGSKYDVVGIITASPDTDGKTIYDIPVRCVHNLADVDAALDLFEPEANIFVGKTELLEEKKIANLCLERGISLLVSHDMVQSMDEYSELSADKVQIEDLLGREEIGIDEKKIAEGVRGMVVLVTGAAGSIGSELVRQICRFEPRLLVLLDHAETPLWLIRQEVERNYPGIEVATSITNVCHKRKMTACMERYHPDLIFHAAAYKHVPLMEENPCTAVVNNVKGTMHIASLAVRYHVKRFIMVSTDKAVNPTSVMGATKRLSEMFVQSLSVQLAAEHHEKSTVFITTRFGNVLGSAGSVVPLFKDQIRRGGPVTVTHPDIMRYFMTIPEACRLILQANSMGKGGEIFVFDMGEQIKISDLAKRMIRLADPSSLQNIQIEYTGLRPGEKLFEELLTDYEQTQETAHKRIRISKARIYDMEILKKNLDELIDYAEDIRQEETVLAMKRMIPEFVSNNSPYQKYDHIDLDNPLTA